MNITYDATPNYTNPCSKSAERLKIFYDHFGIPLNKLVFIAIVCQNSLRLPSAFYHSWRSGHLIEIWKYGFTKWFSWVIEHLEEDTLQITQRGFYDEVFTKYLELFPTSRFHIIDNTYAFDHMQALSDMLATELNLSMKIIQKDIHKNSGIAKKVTLTDYNLARLKQFYRPHERKFLDIIMRKENVKTFPTNEFLKKWNISEH